MPVSSRERLSKTVVMRGRSEFKLGHPTECVGFPFALGAGEVNSSLPLSYPMRSESNLLERSLECS